MNNSSIKSVSDADYRARCFVQGAKRHSKEGDMIPVAGGWHHRFADHPWVRASVVEGWDAELRLHIVREVKIRMMAGTDYGDITKLMPDQKFVDHAREMAERYRLAGEYQDKNPRKEETFKPVLRDVTRNAFREIQRLASRTYDGRARHTKGPLE